jgi:hypothetical protein
MTTVPTHGVQVSPEARRAGALRMAGWLVVLTVASAVSSLALACVTPFAAFGALAALHLRRSEAAILTVMVWATNQAIGFGLLHYPHTAETYAWGAVLLAAALAGAAGAYLAQRLIRLPLAAVAGAFAGALLLQQTAVFLGGLVLGGNAWAFTPAVLFNIAWTNAVTLLAILLLHRLALALAVGLVRRAAPQAQLRAV